MESSYSPQHSDCINLRNLRHLWSPSFRCARTRSARSLNLLCLSIILPLCGTVIDTDPQSIVTLDGGSIRPGDTIRLHAGHYGEPIVVPISGSSTAPITIEGAGDGPISLDSSIVLDHASNIILRNLHIAHAGRAGIILRAGSHDIDVLHNDITDTRLGIWIGGQAGDGNRIEGNHITGSATYGIAIDGVAATAGRENLVRDNRIEDSGIHGIELNANYTIVELNHVSGSGRTKTGASGIHVFARDASEGLGQHNVIRGNVSVDNHDNAAQDGNGIQIDQWCDDNLVTHNLVAGNDGAGISVFDAAKIQVINNTLYGNMRDPGHSHRHRGELVFASDDEHDADHTRDDLAAANIAVATNPDASAILVDRPTSRHPPSFAKNLFWHTPPGDFARWSGRGLADITAWNALAPHTAPDLAADPGMSNPTASDEDSFLPGPQFRTLGAGAP